jgi:cytochrome c-type biogenesis protein
MEVRVFGGIGQLVDSGPLLLAMPVAAAAGAVTFLSPCCLPLVPGYLSYLTGMSGTAIKPDSTNKGGSPASESAVGSGPGAGAVATTTAAAPAVLASPPARGRVMLGTLLFVFGFSVVYMLVGLALGSLGQALAVHQQGISQILGGLVILLGLMFLGAFDRFTFSGRIFKPQFRPQAGLAGAPLLGVLFGLSWSPCIGPTLSAVLALGIGTGSSARAAVLVFVYCLGLGIPFLIVAFAFSRGVKLFGFARRHGRVITQIGGAMLIVVGLLEVTGAWSSAILWLKIHWLANYNSPI